MAAKSLVITGSKSLDMGINRLSGVLVNVSIFVRSFFETKCSTSSHVGK